jgi:PAS domain-containing protein
MKEDAGAGQSLLQNQYLQASHALLTWIEASKSSVERLIDTMPFAFAVLDTEGRVRRGNDALANLLGEELEGCLGLPFTGILSVEDGRAFQRAVARALARPALNIAGKKPNGMPMGAPSLRLVASQGALVGEPRLEGTADSGPVLIETALRGLDGVERHYAWYISRFDGAHPEAQGWISVFGNDVTPLKTFQAKLTHIFATLPIGVMQVDENYQIVEPVSSRTKLLLGNETLVGRSLHELLFEPCWHSLSAREKESTGLLHACIGASEIQFDLVRDNLPRLARFRFEGKTEQTFLGVTYQPVVRDGTVRGFLVLLEDRTERKLKHG